MRMMPLMLRLWKVKDLKEMLRLRMLQPLEASQRKNLRASELSLL